MNDFDKRFEERSKEFDRDFNRTQKRVSCFGIISVIITLALTGFGIWVIVMLLRFFGVI